MSIIFLNKKNTNKLNQMEIDCCHNNGAGHRRKRKIRRYVHMYILVKTIKNTSNKMTRHDMIVNKV